jgi:hypothetical protein
VRDAWGSPMKEVRFGESPQAEPPVCKIINYGKFREQQKENQKKNQQVSLLKEIVYIRILMFTISILNETPINFQRMKQS